MFQSTRPRGARRRCHLKVAVAQVFQSTRPRGARHLRPLLSRYLPVSIHAPARARPPGARNIIHILVFQSTRPRGARRHAGKHHPQSKRVSIHTPARGATAVARARPMVALCFNPRAREGRDDCVVYLEAPLARFQSTRPRGARQVFPWLSLFLVRVSIHAPARGATLSHNQPDYPLRVSIHAPARGATSMEKQSMASRKFQSTRPRGARLLRASAVTATAPVSIHAPARGATNS